MRACACARRICTALPCAQPGRAAANSARDQRQRRRLRPASPWRVRARLTRAARAYHARRASSSSATNRLIHANDRASVQLNIGHVGARACARRAGRPRATAARFRAARRRGAEQSLALWRARCCARRRERRVHGRVHDVRALGLHPRPGRGGRRARALVARRDGGEAQADLSAWRALRSGPRPLAVPREQRSGRASVAARVVRGVGPGVRAARRRKARRPGVLQPAGVSLVAWRRVAVPHAARCRGAVDRRIAGGFRVGEAGWSGRMHPLPPRETTSLRSAHRRCTGRGRVNVSMTLTVRVTMGSLSPWKPQRSEAAECGNSPCHSRFRNDVRWR